MRMRYFANSAADHLVAVPQSPAKCAARCLGSSRRPGQVNDFVELTAAGSRPDFTEMHRHPVVAH
jgi:hypothetical protein